MNEIFKKRFLHGNLPTKNKDANGKYFPKVVGGRFGWQMKVGVNSNLVFFCPV
jgi:hypothetical protein